MLMKYQEIHHAISLSEGQASGHSAYSRNTRSHILRREAPSDLFYLSCCRLAMSQVTDLYARVWVLQGP